MPTGKPTKIKPCAICGELFTPKTPSTRICSKDHYTSCPICDKPMLWNTTRIPEPCSKECRKIATKQHYIEKYGVDHPMKSKVTQQNHRNSMKAKYGVEHALQSEEFKHKVNETMRQKYGTDWALSNKEIKAKATETMVERYGAPTTLQSEILKEKMQETMRSKYGYNNPMKISKFSERAKCTNLDRYGVENPMQYEDFCRSAMKTRIENHGALWTEDMLEKARNTWMDKYGIDNPSHSEEFIAKAKQTCMNKYGVPYGCLTDEAQKHVNRISKTNLRFGELLKSEGLDIQYEFYLDGKLYDIYLPECQTLVEIDPTYTHNSCGNHWSSTGLKLDYHLNKSEIAAKHGYRCIHIFDWDDVGKIVDMLKPKRRIYARNCRIFKLNNDVTSEFLNQYHLQGSCRGQLMCLGLLFNDELVQIMTFGKSRYIKHPEVELLRLCTKPGLTVVGGASKLFNFFVKTYEVNSVISYCDRSKFSGTVYEKLGMKLVRTTPPQEIWSRESDKVTANLLRQRGYDQLFKTDYGKGTSNDDLMLEHGWLPVYDCGQFVYEYHGDNQRQFKLMK